MTLELAFTCPLATGLHARPASLIADVASRYQSSVTLTLTRTDQAVNARSTLAIVSADVRQGDACTLTIDGDDAADACEALKPVIHEILPTLREDSLPQDSQWSVLPRSFQDLGAAYVRGKYASRGIESGRVVNISRTSLPEEFECAAVTPQQEQERLSGAVDRVSHRISDEAKSVSAGPRRDILEAHLSIVSDEELLADAINQINSGESAEQGVTSAARAFMLTLSKSESAYIRQRAIDVEDVTCQILEELGYIFEADSTTDLQDPSIVVAQDLSPRQFLGFNHDHLRGLILEHAGETSHAVILARSSGIPVLTDVAGASSLFADGEEIIIDAYIGIVMRSSEPGASEYLEHEKQKHDRRQERINQLAEQEATTRDGYPLDVAVNVSFPGDLQPDIINLADGVGLLRTELAFSTTETAPTEQQQVEFFARTLQETGDKPVIIRMFDVGADKPLPYVNIPEEQNPALGCRGVRNYADHPDLIRDQLRAILRASAQGNVWLMIPMVSRIEEITQVREWITDIQKELKQEGTSYDPDMKVGIMVEVPLIIFALDEVCGLVDFLSIGTNDLSQYFAAADRCNASVSSLSSVRHPAFLRVLDSILQSAKKHDCFVGMCGDMASDPRNLPLLLGLGLDEISVVGPELARVRSAVQNHTRVECKIILQQALTCRTVEEVEAKLNTLAGESHLSDMLDPELIIIDADCTTRTEAIKLLIDELYITGRTPQPECVEEAVWIREETCTTGLGYGFAIPHCRCQAVTQSTVAVLRLRSPIEWESIDEKPVQCVILLAMSEQDQQRMHMRVFSTLARRLMYDDFRERMLAAPDAEAMHAFLTQELEAINQENT